VRSGRSRQLYLSDWRNETRYHWVRGEMLRWDKLYEKIRSAGKRISFIYVLCQNFSVWTKWMSKERIRKETASRCRPPRYSEMHIYDKGLIFCLGEGPFWQKWRGKESESPDETGKSSLLTMLLNSFSATEGECTRIGFSSLFFRKDYRKILRRRK